MRTLFFIIMAFADVITLLAAVGNSFECADGDRREPLIGDPLYLQIFTLFLFVNLLGAMMIGFEYLACCIRLMQPSGDIFGFAAAY